MNLLKFVAASAHARSFGLCGCKILLYRETSAESTGKAGIAMWLARRVPDGQKTR